MGSSFPPQRPGHPYFAGAPLLIAHRGGARVAPENTLTAFRQALTRWEADMIELDVHLSRDGEVVVIHDPTVDRTTDGTGRVASLPWSELRELDAGYRWPGPSGDFPWRGEGARIPRFEEVLEALPGVRLNVESKTARAARPLLEIVRRHGAQSRVLIVAGRERNRHGARGYSGPWGASARQIRAFWVLHRISLGHFYTPSCDVFQIPIVWRGRRVLSEAFVREAHRRNMPVHVWTVDDREVMVDLLEMGIDGIQTDRPDLLAEVLVERWGRAPPPGLATPGTGSVEGAAPGEAG